jgi:hypothetical protein
LKQLPILFTATPGAKPLVDPFLASHRERLHSAGASPLEFDEATWHSSSKAAGPIGLDVESFPNAFMVCLKRFSDSKRMAFEHNDAWQGLDIDGLRSAITGATIVTFNGIGYDLPMIAYAMTGASPGKLKALSDRIVKGGLRPWEFEREYRISLPKLNHIDLSESNPSVRQGLKVLHGRLHGRFMVDLPFDPDAYLTPEQINHATLYCMHDLDATEGLWHALAEPLALREALSREYKVDFRSKSDAQIGEAIVIGRYERKTGRKIRKTDSLTRPPGTFRYVPPPFIGFQGAELRGMLAQLAQADFMADGRGEITPPEFLKKLKVKVGAAEYTMGIGGLHSNEEHRTVRSDDANVLIDIDVASQYPRIIIKLGLHPPALGPEFIEVYESLVEERLVAKAAGEKDKAAGLKVAIVGVFGKSGSPYSALYSPEMFVATTLTGQLSILGLIEGVELEGIEVVSANTDGLTIRCPSEKRITLHKLIRGWEAETGFTVEKVAYRSIHNASVNSYIAIKEDGTAKRKGPLADPWSDGDLRGQLSKNPQMTILSEACLRYLRDGKPVDETINGCTDPRMFVTLIKANTGAQWRGTPIGRVVRFYWSTDGDPICYVKDGRRVAKTKGARPLLEMTDALPSDLDYSRYIREAQKWLADLGAAAPRVSDPRQQTMLFL